MFLTNIGMKLFFIVLGLVIIALSRRAMRKDRVIAFRGEGGWSQELYGGTKGQVLGTAYIIGGLSLVGVGIGSLFANIPAIIEALSLAICFYVPCAASFILPFVSGAVVKKMGHEEAVEESDGILREREEDYRGD